LAETPSESTMDDYGLMEAIAAGKPAALAVLYDRHGRVVFTLCVRILRDHTEAEDVLASVFWELWTKAARYDAGRGAPLTYLLTLARSRAIDRRRVVTKRREAGAVMEETVGKSQRPAFPTPVEDAVRGEQAGRIRLALDKLDPMQRQAVEMSFFDELSHTEIAQQLNKPLGTIKTYIRQGLIRLGERLRMEQ
jgi:RNA polymerase sigma-70 factor, ECF subfamily